MNKIQEFKVNCDDMIKISRDKIEEEFIDSHIPKNTKNVF